MTVVKAAAVQISPVLYSRDGTVDKIVAKIAELGDQGVQFATFPETIVPYYPYFSFLQAPFELGAEHLKPARPGRDHPFGFDRRHRRRRQIRPAWWCPSGSTNVMAARCTTRNCLFDADGTLLQHRRKITPTYHERIIWGMATASGLRAIDSAVGRIGQLACWEHYNPLFRYA